MMNIITLVVVLAMPGNPDSISRMDMDTIEDCWKAAEVFVSANQVGFFTAGGRGIAAACEVHAPKDRVEM